jgi:hypothetical protein
MRRKLIKGKLEIIMAEGVAHFVRTERRDQKIKSS